MNICRKNGPEKKIINRAMNGPNVEKQIVQCGGSGMSKKKEEYWKM